MTALRKLKPSDKTALAQLLNNKKIWDNLRDAIPHPYHERDAENFIQFANSNPQQHIFAITYQQELCGVIGLFVQGDVYQKSAEIGYWLGEPYWNKGIMSKALKKMTTYGFKELKLVRIFTGVFDYNTASMKVLEKNGYKKEGIFKKAVFKNGKMYDEHRYYQLNKFNN